VPMYEYECRKCGQRTERIESFSGPHMRKCPKCGGGLERLIGAPAIQFKGSGWYVTDYAAKGSGGDSSKAEKAETAAAKDGEVKPAKEPQDAASGKDTKKKAPVKKDK
jgi:putative FmdB family regulatory protein